MPNRNHELSTEKLRRVCDPVLFSFKSTEELAALEGVIGQDRAVKAVAFGIDIRSPGYHMYALGPIGTGKTTTIKKFLQRKAATEPVPDDWCYVNNFEEADKPKTIRLPAGLGCQLEKDMNDLVEVLKKEVPRAFESEEYEKEQQQVQQKFTERRQELFGELEKKARAKGFGLLETPRGILVAPVADGELMTPQQFAQVDERTRQEIEERQQDLQEQMQETVREVQSLQKQAAEQLRELDRQVVAFAVDHLISDLEDKYAEFGQVLAFLGQVRRDILENVQTFKQMQQAQEVPQQLAMLIQGGEPSFDQYKVNLIVDHCKSQGAPVVHETNPTYLNLVGRIEQQAQFGALVTNFTMIKAGALHRANGGYLMLDARDVLLKPFAYEALKRALHDREVRIEAMGEEYRVIATKSLEPEPIPLDVKVVLIGSPMLYYMLYGLDEDFQELFKVKADFAVDTDWADGTTEQYAQFVGTVCREEELKHFAPSGVAKIVEEAARMASDQRKLATQFGDIVDLVRESSYWATKNGNGLVQAEDVVKAIEEQVYRANQIEERIREMIEDGTILIDTEGEVVGQVNGLSVVPLGDYMFGRPSRITARTFVGTAGVVAIDREAELGGPIHNKGVLILAGYLGGKYAEEVPLALSASVTFEQSYGGVEGDSASSTELYALLSSLSRFPIRQDIAVTGSVNQRGEVQAIGGVNHKIEGFFRVCKEKGLTGDQGVLIPQSNVKNLMLCEEVIDAVRDGKFHIYSVSTIDEGIALLTGKEAGERQPDGTYPEGTVNWAVQSRLRTLAETAKKFGKGEPKEEKEES